MTQHSPLPWGISEQTNSFWILGGLNERDADGDIASKIIAQTMTHMGLSKTSKANADLIIDAVNNIASERALVRELAEALREAKANLPEGAWCMDKINAALAKVKP